MSPTGYVICATPRTGSTLLCDLLTAGGAGRPNSYFRREDIAYWAGKWDLPPPTSGADPAFDRTYIAAMVEAGRGGSDVFGLRLMWDSVGEARRRLDSALGGHDDLASRIGQAFGPTLFIHLSRADKAAQAVSLVRARQSGLWHRHADGSERERMKPPAAPVFDHDRLARARDRLRAQDAAWAAFFARRAITPLRLTYEALAADPRSVLADILPALGRDPSAALRVMPRTARMADATNEDWMGRLARE